MYVCMYVYIYIYIYIIHIYIYYIHILLYTHTCVARVLALPVNSERVRAVLEEYGFVSLARRSNSIHVGQLASHVADHHVLTVGVGLDTHNNKNLKKSVPSILSMESHCIEDLREFLPSTFSRGPPHP